MVWYGSVIRTSAVERSEAEAVSELVGDESDNGVVSRGDKLVGSGRDTDRLTTTLFDRQSVTVTAPGTCCDVISLARPQRHVTELNVYHLQHTTISHMIYHIP